MADTTSLELDHTLELLKELRRCNPAATSHQDRAEYNRELAWIRALDALDRLLKGSEGAADAMSHFLDGARYAGASIECEREDARQRVTYLEDIHEETPE